MIKKLTHKQQLQIIEGLCLIFQNGDTSKIELANRCIEGIYKIAHLNLTCENLHLDWHEEGIELAKQMRNHGITNVEGI